MVGLLKALVYGAGGMAVLVALQERLVYVPVLPALAGAYSITPSGLRLVYEDITPGSSATRSPSQMSYTDAIKLLTGANKKFEFPVKWGLDLQSEHERYITEAAFGGRPIIIRDYLKSDTHSWLVVFLRVKLQCRPTKIATGGIWICGDMDRVKYVPHAGFGLGFKRLVQFATGIYSSIYQGSWFCGVLQL